MSARYQERFARIEQVLLIDKRNIDMDELRAGCSYGMPDALRPLGWRLLLNYLPVERQCWKEFLGKQRDNYASLVDQLIIKPGKAEEGGGGGESDHPLAMDSHSEWSAFFQDNTVLSQIDKDCRRLYPEIQFFQQDTKFPHRTAAELNLSGRVTGCDLKVDNYEVDKFGAANLKQSRGPADDEYTGSREGNERHWQVVERILFIYSKLNPGVKYVQGMNEVLGPVYYVFASDPDREWAEHAEADAFFCFQQLMSEVKDNFIKKLDHSNCGIESQMQSFHRLIEDMDPEIHDHLVGRLQIKPQFYAFRWLSLLLSQEFPLPDVICLWDSLFADPDRFSLLPYVCLAMIDLARERLLEGDFADCLRLLQNYPETDALILVTAAMRLRGSSPRLRPSDPAPRKQRLAETARNIGSRLKEVLKR